MASFPCYKHSMHLPYSKGTGLIVGKTASGKTQLMLDMLARAQLRPEGPTWDKVVVLSKTAKMQLGHYGGIPDKDIHDDPDEFGEILASLEEHQTNQLKHGRPRPVLIIMDDIVGCFKGSKDGGFGKKFEMFVTAGRHMSVNLWIITQYAKDRSFSNPTVRGNLNWLVCAEIEDTSRDKFIELMGVKKSDGEATCRAAWSEPYRFVACNKDASMGAKDKITFIKIDPRETPKLVIKYRD